MVKSHIFYHFAKTVKHIYIYIYLPTFVVTEVSAFRQIISNALCLDTGVVLAKLDWFISLLRGKSSTARIFSRAKSALGNWTGLLRRSNHPVNVVRFQCQYRLVQRILWVYVPESKLAATNNCGKYFHQTNFNLSPSYSAHKSSNHKFSKIYKISPDTNLYNTKHTYKNIKHKNMEDLILSVLPL